MLELKNVEKGIIDKNKELYGKEICKHYFIEEAAELTKELTKSIRCEENRVELIKELSDVYYTLSMLVQEYGVSSEEINENIIFKEIKAKRKLGLL